MITFKNVSQARNLRRSPSPSQLRGQTSHRDRWKETLPVRPGHMPGTPTHRSSSSLSGLSPSNVRMHKPSPSLSTSNGFPKPQISSMRNSVSGTTRGGENKHRRSVSIVSLGGEAVDEGLPRSPQLNSQRPAGGHTRSASLQLLPRRTAMLTGAMSPGGQTVLYTKTQANDIVRDSKRTRIHRTFSHVSRVLHLC